MTASPVGVCPDWVAEPGRKLWEELSTLISGEVKPTDRSAMILMCASYAASEVALKDLNERGPLIEGDRGLVKNPANQIAREQGALFRTYATDFGLTPAARKRLALKLDGQEEKQENLID